MILVSVRIDVDGNGTVSASLAIGGGGFLRRFVAIGVRQRNVAIASNHHNWLLYRTVVAVHQGIALFVVSGGF